MKMNKKKFITSAALAVLTFAGSVHALSSAAFTPKEPILKPCTYTEDYIKWQKLSDEEKQKVPMPAICDMSKDKTKTSNRSNASSLIVGESELPEKYDIREQNYIVPVKYQEQTNGCWAFATTTNLEVLTKKLYNKEHTFSTRHMEYSITRSFPNDEINEYGFNRTLGEGANYFHSSNYLINGLGPIAESEMPFENNENAIEIDAIKNKTVLYDTNDIALEFRSSGSSCTSNEIAKIKELVYNYGSVAANINMSTEEPYYNESEYALYYNGSEDINHAITIVGWDDTYSKDNFVSTNKPSSNGAWIVQNSYSSNWGENGYFYVSYEDIHICSLYMSVKTIDEEIEDNAYVHDKLGFNMFFGYSNSSTGEGFTNAYMMNVFTKAADTEEELTEVTFAASGAGSYTLYYQEGNGATASTTKTEIGTGTIVHGGYTTHKLTTPITIDSDVTDFSIIIYVNLNESTTPIAVSSSAGSKYEYITLDAQKSYISYDGTNWSDLTTIQSDTILIASLKAYTNDVTSTPEPTPIPTITTGEITTFYGKNTGEDYLYKVTLNATYENIEESKLNISVIDTENNEIPYSSMTLNENSISFIINEKLVYNTYFVKVYYDNELISTTEFNVGDKLESTAYEIDQINMAIYAQPNTDLATFIANMEGLSEEFKANTDLVLGTGTKVDDYTLIIKGDVTGDGQTRMNDVMKISYYLVNGTNLDESYNKLASDVTGDLDIRMNDVMKISYYIVEGGSL